MVLRPSAVGWLASDPHDDNLLVTVPLIACGPSFKYLTHTLGRGSWSMHHHLIFSWFYGRRGWESTNTLNRPPKSAWMDMTMSALRKEDVNSLWSSPSKDSELCHPPVLLLSKDRAVTPQCCWRLLQPRHWTTLCSTLNCCPATGQRARLARLWHACEIKWTFINESL